jgi:hypothetical protein
VRALTACGFAGDDGWILIEMVFGASRLVAEARAQVKEAAERLGGEYSGSLHPKCTHLVVQISFARTMQSMF